MSKEKIENKSISLNKPVNLVLEDLLITDKEFFLGIRQQDSSLKWDITTGSKLIKHIPALYYFVHMLLERQNSDIDALRFRYDKEYVQMFSRDIEPLKSKNYFKYMWGILRMLGVIENICEPKPNKYRQSAQAYYFRFTIDFQSSEIISHQVLMKKQIADKLEKKWKKEVNASVIDISTVSVRKELAHQYHALKNIIFDSAAAIDHIKKSLNDKNITIAQYNTCMLAINDIIDGRIRLNYSSECKRYFTTVTQMPKELRQFIRDREGNSLVELDFASFNAFAVYKILNTINPEYTSNAEKIAFKNEVDLYRDLLSGGDFYRDFNEVFFTNETLSREEIKEIVLRRWFNGRLNSRNKYRKHMLKRLPRISEVIDSLKAMRYQNFSITTMKMESELVNDIIYKKFVELHPDAIMYTIFDSFLIEQKYAARLLSIMQKEGSRYFNLNCIVKEKNAQTQISNRII